MTNRTSTTAVALALVLAACSADTTSDSAATAPTTAAPVTTTTTSPPVAEGPSVPSGSVEAPEPMLLSYDFEPDSALTYAIDLDQKIVLHADGDAEALDEDDLPIDADLDVSASSTMSYEVYPGPREDTYEIVITAQFDDVDVTGTVNGEAPDEFGQDDLTSEFTAIDPVSTSVIVDSAGNVISSDGAGLDLFGGGVGALGGLATDDLGRPVGPEFPTDRELAVGDTWSETISEDGPDGNPIMATVTHTVVDAQRIDDATTLVIESVTETEAIELDFTEFFRALFEGFAGLGAESGEAEVPADMQEMLDQLAFTISIAPSTSTATTWFDPESGLVRRSEAQTAISMSMVFRAPDDTTGELVGFEMDMDLEQSVTLALLGDSA